VGVFQYTASNPPVVREAPQPVVQNANQETIHTLRGYEAIRLPLPRSIMPTALAWTRNETLAIASLKGHVFLAQDTNKDGIEDQLQVFEEGLAAPYGLIADEDGTGLLVAHKPELLRLRDTDGDGRADLRQVVATGWGYNDNYHDWTCGIVRDSKGRLYVGLGSDYTQPKRLPEQQRWRGKILRIDRSGNIEPIASGLRYPTGLAMTPDDELFVSDNQGEQNTFNELNHIISGERYGVPSLEDRALPPVPARRPAIQIPHPWTRSINGIFFLPRDAQLANGKPHPFAGHGIGCEYDTRYLIRFSLQKVGETFQGAVYPFSQDQVPPETPNFEGTLCGGVSPRGDIYIGCIHDSGWLGGLNVGSLYRLRQAGEIPLGVREIQVLADGFTIDFTGEIDPATAAISKNFTISAYTREWQGDYATPDSQRHQVGIKSVSIASDHRRVILHTDKLREGFVYELTCGKIGPDGKAGLWPATGHYTVNRVPESAITK
ncbi:MAG: Cytochrome c, partial [Planctomycetaceae bacterium]|nr:Cytochrome c [Planctomycetaceae bacterium]